MMDPEVCDKVRPGIMQPSVAVFEYEPDDTLDVGDKAFKVSYLKVTCSVTSYGATNLDRLRKGRRIVTSPYNEFIFNGSSYEAKKTDTFDSSQQIGGADLPCFGALLEISVGPSSGTWPIDQYPYFSDFDPKKRELYELVSKTGEIMSRTLEHAGVLHGGTTSSSNEVFDKTTVGVSASGTYGAKQGSNVSAEGSYASEEGSRSVDATNFNNVRTVDGGREARETYSHTTQLSQMYQLLTSYHLGTNRGVFFFEPRPHLVQVDRTLVDGPRQLEGIQEFFLVVVRPRAMESLCVGASLETLHVGAIVLLDEKTPDAQEPKLLFPRIGMNGSWEDPDDDKTFPAETTIPYTAPPGWMIDQFKGTNGYHLDYLSQKGNTQHKIEVTASTVSIWGRVEEHHIEGGFGEKDRRESGFLELGITIYLKQVVATPARTQQFAILTNTSVCTCAQGLVEMVKNSSSVVREMKLPTTGQPVGQPMPEGAARDWNKFFGQVVRSSMTAPDRYPKGAVGFWDLDIMKEPIADLVRGKEFEGLTIGKLVTDAEARGAKLDDETRAYLGRREVKQQPFAKILRPSLREFAEGSGLGVDRAAAVRRMLWAQLSKVTDDGTPFSVSKPS
jgi:hypothetical protein